MSFLLPHPPPPAISTLSLHDALPISPRPAPRRPPRAGDGRHRFLRVDRRPRAVRGEQPSAAARRRLLDRRSEEHTSELQSRRDLVCRLLLEKKKRDPPVEVCPSDPEP